MTRTYGGATEPAKSLAARGDRPADRRLGDHDEGDHERQRAFTLKVSPKVTTTYTVRVAGVAGHDDASAAPVTVTVVP